MGFVGSPGGSSSAATTTAVQQQYYACQLPAGELGTVNLVGYALDCSLWFIRLMHVTIPVPSKQYFISTSQGLQFIKFW
jgi:hypothetical protein